ncbi:MAG: DUF3592 domain-containing protein [Myxococcales bacterium]|nr:DUF3592 domain-containing protein [Myxococcales bacterium]
MESDIRGDGLRSRGRRVRRVGTIVFALVWCAVVTGMLVFVYQTIVAPAEASKAWTAVPCTVVESKVVAGKDDEGDPTYAFSVRIRYVVDGITYEGGRHQVTSVSSHERASRDALVARYPVGSQQTAYYDPANPKRAVLVRGEAGVIWYLLIFLGGFELVGIVLLLRGFGLLSRRR